MSLPTLSFTQALVIGGLALTLVFYLLFRFCNHKFTFANVSRHLPSFAHHFSLGYIALMMSLILITVYSVHLGYRPWIYFLILSLVVLYVAFGNNQGRPRIQNISIILLVSLLLPITVLANNNFLDFGTDQGAHLRRGLEIVETGGWEQRAGISYYEPFPILEILLASVTIVTGFSPNVYVFLLPVCSLLFALILYSLSKKITGSERVSTLALFIVLSIPPLTFLWLIPRDLSIIFAFISLYLVTKLLYDTSRAAVLSLIPCLTVMVISHASGPVFILSLFSPLAIYSVIPRHSSRVPHQFRFVSILTVLIMLTYWVFNYMVILSVIGATRDLFMTIIEYLSGAQLSVEEAARPYLQASAELTHVWFAWAIPPAIVAGYSLRRLHDKIISRSQREYGHWTHKMVEFGSAGGLMLLLVSFLLAYFGHYTYLIIPTYALLAFLVILLLSRLLSSKNELVMVVTVFILAVSLFVGGSSPNWAPIENPDFPARVRLYNKIVYTKGFGQNLPQNVSMILDFDVYPDIPEGVNVEAPRSYRVGREILILFERGVSINELASDDSYIFVVRSERLVLNGGDAFNLVRSSGKYAMITPVHYIVNKTSP